MFHSAYILLVTLVFIPQMVAGAPRLLPFQGHLTSAAGEVVPDGAKVVQFKIYDAPVSGSAIWAGEVHKLSVNQGLVNTVLGARTAFPATYAGGAKVTFSEPLYVEVTVDANNDGIITPADPPLLPRQILLPANFAHVAQSVRSAAGREVISASGEIDGSSFAAGSILPEALSTIPLEKLGIGNGNGGLGANQIAIAAITSSELANSSVASNHIRDGAIATVDLGDGQVTPSKLASGGFPGTLLLPASLPVNRLAREYAYFWDQKPSTQDGGASIRGVQTRTLNQEFIAGNAISRTANQFTLQPGQYRVSGSAPAYAATRHQVHLFNLTTEMVALVGTSEIAHGGNVSTRSKIFGFLTVESPSVFELKHFIATASGAAGLGGAPGTSLGSGVAPPNVPAVYSEIYIEKLK